ncbi:MAG: hypothetical protein AAF629_35810, partial [Chloroflexota bacterium]
MAIAQEKSTVVSQPKQNLSKRLREILGPDWREAYVFMLPTVILLGGIIAYPFIQALYLSFTRTIG